MTQRRFLVAYGLWIFVIVAYFLPGATWSPVSRFDLTRSIVEHRTFSIDGLEESTGDRAHRGDHWYSDKAPIPSLLAVPAYAIARLVAGAPSFEVIGSAVRVNRVFSFELWMCSLATAGLATALLAALVFETLRARIAPAAALACASITVLATPIFPYATSFYGHAVAALFLFVAARVAAMDDPSRTHVGVAGACIALAVGCEYLTVVPGAVLAAYIVHGERRRVIDLAIGAAIPVAVIAAYHTACFGAPWHTGYAYLVRPSFVEGHAQGVYGIRAPRLVALAGLLVGTRRGLFFVAPVSLLGVIGLFAGYRADRACRVALVAAIAMLVCNAGYYMWWGGAAAGPRHLVPVLPLLAYGYASRSWWTLAVLGALSFILVLALTTVGLEAPEHGNVWTEYVWPNLARNHVARIPGASNLGMLAGLRGVASIVPLLIWAVGGFGALASICSKK